VFTTPHRPARAPSPRHGGSTGGQKRGDAIFDAMTLAYRAEAAESRSGGRWLERLLNFWFYPPVH
jgi:hypothetical protein